MRLSTLLLWALNPQGARARWERTYESENKAHALVNLDIFSKITHLLEFITACWCLLPNAWKYMVMRIEKKKIENKDEYVSESVTDFYTWHETHLLGHHRPLKKRELTKWDTNSRGYTRAFEASVSIYILALALPRVLSARVYSWHQILDSA